MHCERVERNFFVGGDFNVLCREQNNFVKVVKICFGKIFIFQRSKNVVRGKFYFVAWQVEKTKLRYHSLVKFKLNVNFLGKLQKFFFRHEQRLFYSVVDTKLREGVAARETIAQSDYALFILFH